MTPSGMTVLGARGGSTAAAAADAVAVGDAAGFATLLDLFAAAGDSGQEPIPVAIETSRGLLVACLRATGRDVFVINPLAVSRYRDRHSVARKKSDAGDALVLAHILRTDQSAHRALPADSELAQAVAVLACAQENAGLGSHLRAQQVALTAARVLPGESSRRSPTNATACSARTPAPSSPPLLPRARPRGSARPNCGRCCDAPADSAHRRRSRPAPGDAPRRVPTPTPAGRGRAGPSSARAAPPNSIRPASTPTSSPPPSSSSSRPTPTRRSSPASPGSVRSPVPACSLRSATTVPLG